MREYKNHYYSKYYIKKRPVNFGNHLVTVIKQTENSSDIALTHEGRSVIDRHGNRSPR